MTDTTEVQRYCDGVYVRATDYDALAAKLGDAERVARYESDIAQQALDQMKAEKARAEAAEARIAHLENHIEAVAKDTHKIMVAYSDRREGMTKFTDEQIKYLETKITFLDEGDVKKGFSVLGSVEGNVWGDVKGSVLGSVWGSVEGDVEGSVKGSVKGNVKGSGIQIGEKE